MSQTPIELTGLKIKEVRKLTKAEMAAEGWDDHRPVTALVLEDGTMLYPSMDAEGNGPGAFFGTQGGRVKRSFGI